MTVGIQREGVRARHRRGLGRKELSHERHRRTRGREREAEMRAGMGVLTSTSLVMVNSTPSEPGVAP